MIYAPSLWLDVTWETLEALKTILQTGVHHKAGPIVDHEIDNLTCAIEAQLQKRPLPAAWDGLL